MPIQTLEEKRWQDTLQALQSVRQGKVIDGDKVHEWLESWGMDNELDAPQSITISRQDFDGILSASTEESEVSKELAEAAQITDALGIH